MPTAQRQTIARRYGALAALAGILLAAGVLRGHHLGQESAWLDEAFSIHVATTSIANILKETAADIHPPLFYFVLLGWEKVVGHSEAAARALSVVFDLSGIAAAYAFGRRLVGAPAALIAAVILAISPFHIEFAQEARMYALLGLLSTASMWAFVVFMERRTQRAAACYVVLTSLLTYTHIYGFFILAAQGLTIVMMLVRDPPRGRAALRAWTLPLAAVGALYLPWMFVLVDQVFRVQQGFWIATPTLETVRLLFQTYAGSETLLRILAAASVLGLVRAVVRSKTPLPASDTSPPAAVVLVSWLVCPIGVPFALSQLGSSILLPKYSIAASIPFALLAGAGVALLPFVVIRTAATAVIAYLAIDPLQAFYTTRRRDDWRAATSVVLTQAQPYDRVFFYRFFNEIPFAFYNTRQDLLPTQLTVPEPLPSEESLAMLIRRAIGDRDRVWLMMLQFDPAAPTIVRQFRAVLPEMEEFESFQVRVYRFRRTTRPTGLKPIAPDASLEAVPPIER